MLLPANWSSPISTHMEYSTWNSVIQFTFNLWTTSDQKFFLYCKYKKPRQNSNIAKKYLKSNQDISQLRRDKINKLPNSTQYFVSLRRKIHFHIRDIRSAPRSIFREAISKYNNKHRSRRAQLGFGWTVVRIRKQRGNVCRGAKKILEG